MAAAFLRPTSRRPWSRSTRARSIYDANLAVREKWLVNQHTREVSVTALGAGMVFEDVRFANGTLLVARGYEVTRSFIERVANFPLGSIRSPVQIQA